MKDLLEDILEDPDSSRESLCNDTDDEPIRIVICEKSFLSILGQLRMKCRDAGWTFQMIPCHKLPGNPPMSDSQMQALNTIQPRNPILKIIKKIENAMTTLHCSLHRGQIYVKPKRAMYTYVHYKDVESFLNELTANESFAEDLIGKIPTIASILNSNDCNVIQQMQIDYNLIEVLGGQVFNIEQKQFMPINAEDLVGHASPRAYVPYDPRENPNPNPKLFIEFLDNSFDDEVEKKAFLRKYYQCLCHNKFHHKTRKLCIVGERDSGKTSLLAPLQGIIPISKIATLTREKQFSTQMVNPETELVFVDEWSPQTLDAEAAKKLLQGGYFVTAIKHKVFDLVCAYSKSL